MDEEFQLRWVHVPKGTHLSSSRRTAGMDRDLLREDGTNKNLGPPESKPADLDNIVRDRVGREEIPVDQERDEYEFSSEVGDVSRERTFADELRTAAAEAIVDAVLEQIIELLKQVDWNAVAKRSSVVLRRTAGRASTRLRSLVNRTKSSDARISGAPELAPDLDPGTQMVTQGVTMSRAEFLARMKAVIIAEAFADWQRRELANAVVSNEDLSAELQQSVLLVLDGGAAELTPSQLEGVLELLQTEDEFDETYLAWHRREINTPEKSSSGD
jgi:hypothetical protein